MLRSPPTSLMGQSYRFEKFFTLIAGIIDAILRPPKLNIAYVAAGCGPPSTIGTNAMIDNRRGRTSSMLSRRRHARRATFADRGGESRHSTADCMYSLPVDAFEGTIVAGAASVRGAPALG